MQKHITIGSQVRMFRIITRDWKQEEKMLEKGPGVKQNRGLHVLPETFGKTRYVFRLISEKGLLKKSFGRICFLIETSMPLRLKTSQRIIMQQLVTSSFMQLTNLSFQQTNSPQQQQQQQQPPACFHSFSAPSPLKIQQHKKKTYHCSQQFAYCQVSISLLRTISCTKFLLSGQTASSSFSCTISCFLGELKINAPSCARRGPP